MYLGPIVARNGVAGTTRRGVMTFMAECFWPGVTAQKVADAGERLRHAAQAIVSDDGPARYLGSLLVPSDEIALCLFEAASIDVATEVNRRAAVPSERILEIVRLGAFRPSGRDPSTTRQRRFDEPSQ
jgi:hypothetical protein